MRRIVYSAACSLDGYIAREDHSADWIPHDQDYGLGAFFETVDTVLVGRKTHDFMVGMRQPAFPGMMTCVFTRSPSPPEYKDVHWVTSDTVGFLHGLREQPGKDIWLMGGSDLARTLFEARLVNELRLKVVPILLGKGVPLYSTCGPEIALHLLEQEGYSNGVQGLRYECL
jgi:dihydrofolate reductase